MSDQRKKESSYTYLSVVMEETFHDSILSDSMIIPEEVTLKDITLRVKQGEFVCIIGEIGSGKSSLLNSLIGDLKYVSMKELRANSLRTSHWLRDSEKSAVTIRGSVGYVQQVPWIQNQSIRENILFGYEFDKERYEEAVRLCELERDLEQLPGGDLTEIGERGINISGGQKARVSLARAVYSDADIMLMDDPLSALDANVRKKIFLNCLLEKFKNKTRILVTHALQFLPFTDKVILMEGGRIIFLGNYEQFKTQSFYDQKILKIQRSISNSKSPTLGAKKSSTQTPPPLNLSPTTSENEEGKVEEQSQMQNKEDILAIKEEDEPPEPRKATLMSVIEKKITDDEDEEKTSVEFGIYKMYFSMGGGRCFIVAAVILGSIWVTLVSVVDYWLGYSSSQNNQYSRMLFYYGILAMLILLAGVIILARVGIFMRAGLQVSRKIHIAAVRRVLRAPINLFFDKTPTGRIQNRFSKDQNNVDLQMSANFMGSLNNLLLLLSQIILACIVNVWILIPLPVFGYFSYRFLKFFNTASRQFYRLENITRSPILHLLGQIVSGASTIRAFNKEKKFNRKMRKVLDDNLKVSLIGSVANSFFAVGLNMIAFCFTAITLFLCIHYKNDWDPTLVGLVLSYLLSIQWCVIWMFRLFIFNQGKLVSFERLINFTNIIQEAPAKSLEYDPPENEWPALPTITFENYWLRYRPDTDPVLKNLNFKIKAGEKIGVVGRTGAGKSTICLALLRIVEPFEGCIYIDGQNIHKMGLALLRRKITIIPQDPMLFKGTLKYNLDPLSEFTDFELKQVCDRSGLSKVYQHDPKGIEMELEQNGSNLSSGQRQVLCICRALLKKSKIIVMDEATANIDIETELTIQTLIHQEFSHATVLTVAHRINTIITSDKVMVLEMGEMKEFDAPKRLLKNPDSLFSNLLKELKTKEDKPN